MPKEETKFYSLPALPYEYSGLEPVMSEEQLATHYEKHHKKYVDNANEILETLDSAHAEKKELDYKSILKSLSFNVGGHVLHSLFWENLRASDEDNEMSNELKKAIEEEFGSIDNFKAAFSKTAESVEGSGWAALTYCRKTKRLILMQIEKHNVNVYPMFSIILVLDVWEHAYYIDHKNNRKKFIESFWDIVSWREVSNRFEEAKQE
jgi:Fe-Mn family superoxide dismutase